MKRILTVLEMLVCSVGCSALVGFCHIANVRRAFGMPRSLCKCCWDMAVFQDFSVALYNNLGVVGELPLLLSHRATVLAFATLPRHTS